MSQVISRAGARGIRHLLEDFIRSTPARFALLVFTGLIAVTATLLALPISSRTGDWTPIADAVFTATSTICVTGLATLDMSTHWSAFGNTVIVLGMQIGGIGVLTLASILGLVVSRRLGLRQRLIAASDITPARVHAGPVTESQAVRLGEIGSLLATVALSLLVIEALISLSLIPRLLVAGADPWTATWQGFYLATSAFTNTGFTPNPGGLAPFATDPWMLTTLAVAVLAGSVGFPVIFGLVRRVRTGARLTLHVKLTLLMTGLLVLVGGLGIWALEATNPATLAPDPAASPFTALFSSVMTRSGGLATIDMAATNGSTKLVIDMLMFVGGGSASTAGGIKVTTLAVLFLAAVAEARGENDMHAFGRRIPTDVLRLAVSIVLWGATIVASSSVVILQLTGLPLDIVLFDVISAFATCGLSTGLPALLPEAGKYVLSATMWAGRVGTVTLAAALAAKDRRQLYTRAEERPIVG